MSPVQEYDAALSASFVRVHDRVDVWPDVILPGLKEAVHEGALVTVTGAEQVPVVPALLATVRVQVWFPVGLKFLEPVAPDSVPDPRFPVQEYEAVLSASLFKVHDRLEL